MPTDDPVYQLAHQLVLQVSSDGKFDRELIGEIAAALKASGQIVTPIAHERKPFNEELASAITAFGRAQLEKLPEVRSLMVVIDYHGELNDLPGLKKAVRIGQTPGTQSTTEMFGMMFQTAAVLEDLLKSAFKLAGALRDDVQKLLESAASVAKGPPSG